MKHILMVCYGGGHMKVIAPLYTELSNNYRVTVLALTSAGTYMRDQGIPSLGFHDFSFTRSPEIQEYGSDLASDIPENSVVSREETIAYLGASLFDLINDLGCEEAAYNRYRIQGRGAFLPVASLQKIIAELKADGVVTTNAPRAERAALIAAKSLGLPSLCINDNLWITGGVLDVARENLADKICVLTNDVRERLINEAGVDGDKIIVTGSPVFDRLKKYKRKSSSNKKPRVLLADQVLPYQHPFLDIKSVCHGIDEKVRVVLNSLASNGIIDVFFRPHPSQEYNYTEFNSCSLSPKSEDLHERLSMTDIVITAISTVGIEGKAMGLGLVSIEDTVFSTQESYEKLGLSTGIRKAEELESAIFNEYAKLSEKSENELYQGISTINIRSVLDRLLDVNTITTHIRTGC